MCEKLSILPTVICRILGTLIIQIRIINSKIDRNFIFANFRICSLKPQLDNDSQAIIQLLYKRNELLYCIVILGSWQMLMIPLNCLEYKLNTWLSRSLHFITKCIPQKLDQRDQKWYCTLFENHPKCLISIFQFWYFLPISDL